MAGNTEEQNRDTTQVSRKAWNWFIAVSAPAAVGAAIALFGLYADSVRHSEQIRQLIDFGPKTGDRWTERMATEANNKLSAEIMLMRRELQQLRVDMHSHADRGAHNVADQRLRQLEKDVDDCCDHKRFQFNGLSSE